jgi:gliding motility-associated-like protein
MRYWLKIVFVLVMTCQLKSQSMGGNTSGSTSFCSVMNSGFISLIGYTGAIQHWESSVNNGINWTLISNPTSTQNYSNLNQTTWYRAIVKNGSFPQDTSTMSVITIYTAANGGSVIGGGSFCQSATSGTLNLTGNVGQVVYWESSINSGSTWSVITNTFANLPYTTITQNTLYRAIVKNVPSCPSDTSSVASFVISQNTFAGNLLKSDTVCTGANLDTLQLYGQVGNITHWIKSTNAGATWTNINNTSNSYIYSNITQTTNYAVVIKNGACPSDTTSLVNIIVVNAQSANAGPDKTIIQYESIQLEGSGYGTPEWSPNKELSDPNIFTPSANPLNTTTYLLTLTDQHSCSSTDSMVVNVIVPIPTAITPNGDGVNDYFLMDKVDEYSENSFTVFNRWGSVVYKAIPYKNDWNGVSKSGGQLPDDVYYYVFDYGTGEKPTAGYILIKR